MKVAALRIVEGEFLVYKRVWKGSVFSSFLQPVLYLAAMGLGLGTLVDRGAGESALQGLRYVEFLAPGLLAAAAMQTGAGESSFPVMAGLKWRKTYEARVATPIGVADLVVGHLLWVGIRVAMASLAFMIVSAALGVIQLGGGLVAVLVCVLVGLAYGAPIMAYAASLDNDLGLSHLFRYGIVPMFLFSGTFFPVSQLPDAVEPVALVVPLWHGVQVVRHVTIGLPAEYPLAVHIGYLLLWIVAATPLAVWRFRRRLKP